MALTQPNSDSNPAGRIQINRGNSHGKRTKIIRHLFELRVKINSDAGYPYSLRGSYIH